MSDYIAGFRYFFDIHMAMSRGPVDELMEIRVGDRPAWRGSSTDNTPIEIEAPQLFGGDEGEGGVQGTFLPLFGGATQTAPSEMSSILQTPMPGFRRRMTAFFSGMISAMNPYPKPWKFKLRRTTAGWDGDCWYPDKATIQLLREVSVGEVPPIEGEGLVTETVTTTVSGTLTETGEFVPAFGSDGHYFLAIPLPEDAELVYGEGEAPAPVGEVYVTNYGGWYDPASGFAPTKQNLTWAMDWTVAGGRLYINGGTVGLSIHGAGAPVYFTYTYTRTYLPPGANTSLRTIKAMNPAHIIYECLTNREWGRGLPRSRLDDTVWRLAADQLWEEQFGLCIRWTRQQPIQQFIGSILDHIGAVIYTDRKTSLIRLRLIRADYTRSSVPLFDSTNGLLDIKEAPVSSPGPMTSEVKISYRDPITDEERVVRAVNLAALRASGGEINSSTKSYPGLPTQEIADRVAKRELRASSTTLRRFSMTFDRRGSQFVPGGVIRIQDYARNIPDTVVRIVTVDYGSPRDGKINVQAVQDVFGLPARGFAALPPPSWTPPNWQPCVGMIEVFELPYRSVYRRLSAADFSFVPDEAGYIGVALAEGQPLNASYDIAVRTGLPEPEDEPSGEGSYCGFSRAEYGGNSLNAGYTVGAVGSSSLNAGYAVGAAGSSSVSTGFTVDETVTAADVVVSTFEGTDGQTTGIGNAGTSGGEWSGHAALSNEHVFAGATALKVDRVGAFNAEAIHTPDTVVPLGAGVPWTWEGRIRLQVSTEFDSSFSDVGSGIIYFGSVVDFTFFTEGSGFGGIDFLAAAIGVNTAVVGGAGQTFFPDSSAVTPRTYFHMAFSCDESGVVRWFIDGISRGSVSGVWADSGYTGYSGTSLFAPGNGYGSMFVDNVRLRYGFAYTADFTPDATI